MLSLLLLRFLISPDLEEFLKCSKVLAFEASPANLTDLVFESDIPPDLFITQVSNGINLSVSFKILSGVFLACSMLNLLSL
jgi:hypothetical protein